jgi:hypothetical protein
MSAGPASLGPRPASARSEVARAASGCLLVFVAALAFFGFVIGSDLLGSVGQGSLAFVFASAALLYAWFRLDHETRRRFAVEVRRFVRRAPSRD